MVNKAKDISGSRFDKLVVLSREGAYKDGHVLWKCKCDCGEVVVRKGSNLRRNSYNSCGCHVRRKIPYGKKFGRLIPLGYWAPGVWTFECDCGVTKNIRYPSVLQGRVVSCGCYNSEKSTGEKNPRWKGGKMIGDSGYVYLTSKVTSGKQAGKTVLEHRKVMEKHIGRELRPEETVHHKNGERGDNRLENLELWSSAHPPGQRVEDKIKWAIEFIQLYGYKVE